MAQSGCALLYCASYMAHAAIQTFAHMTPLSLALRQFPCFSAPVDVLLCTAIMMMMECPVLSCRAVLPGATSADITFFGEPLPARFHRRRLNDLAEADLLIVMGTSLLVQPFAGMIGECYLLKNVMTSDATVSCAKTYPCGNSSVLQCVCDLGHHLALGCSHVANAQR